MPRRPRVSGRRLSPVDAAWLRMDSPTNPMVITAILGFDGALDHGDLETLVRTRLLADDRFRLRTRTTGILGYPVWEDDPAFELGRHVVREALPPNPDRKAVEAAVSELMSRHLERQHPLWQLHHLTGHPQGSILVARIHHSLGDGVGLVKVLLRLTDEGDARGRPQQVGLPVAPTPPGLRAATRELATRAGVVAKLLALPPDPPSAFRGALGTRKVAAWSRPLVLDEIKDTARRLGASMNDLMLTAVTGALRAHHVALGRTPADGIRALVPVYLRDGSAATTARRSNQFGLVFVPLPLAVAEAGERLRRLKAAMDRLKGSAEARVAMGVIGLMGLANATTERLGVELFTQKATLLVTNVPGPSERVHLAGAPVRDLMVWAPQSGRVGLGVSILSYAGAIRIGISSDARLLPEPQSLVQRLEEELVALAVA